MHALRDRSVRGLTAVIAGLALYLQLAFAGPGMLSLGAAANSSGLLAEHALCLAGGGGQPQPAGDAPAAPAHDHGIFCCLWHPLPGLTPQAAAAPLPVSYASAAPSEPRAAPRVPAPRHRPAQARAPPSLV